jgi:2,3-dihydroxyphenylpropionate 1,2-dioxygenase
VPSEISFELVRQLYRAGFDPAFTSTAEIDYALGIPLAHLGIEPNVPVLPIYVNAYLPPQPTMERCYAFGNALANAVTRLGLRTVVVASGGMSHFPGTDRYSNPELDWDNRVLDKLREGKLKSLIGYDEKELDDTGNIELRCWAVAAGALGERVPDVCQMNPSWHHNYASVGWYSPVPQGGVPHYPELKPELVQLIAAFHALAHEPQARTAYLDNPEGYADRYQLAPAQRAALIKLDMPAVAAMGAHPLVPFLANMQIERLKKGAK